MAAATEPLELAAGFPPATEEQWRSLVAAVLRRSGLAPDADPVEALTSTTYEGLRIRPLYTAASADPGRPGQPPYVRGATADGATATGWDVRTRHDEPDPARVRAAALADLATGATSLWLGCGPLGLPVAALADVLDDVQLALAPIVLDAGAGTVAAARVLLDAAERQGVAAAELRGSLGADPVGLRARTGAAVDAGLLAELAGLAAGRPQLCLATVDGTVYHDAGGSDADELAALTSVGVGYLRTLTDAGLPLEQALAAIEFRLAVTADQFASIAKLRAARRLWGRVAELCGAPPRMRGQRQHAVTSAAMMTRRDPWVNLLRTTVACFAAAVGGAEAITVLPFDAAVGRSDEFARRIARNTSAILHDESSLGRVVDAAGGSYYVESRTADLAERAWAGFTALERDGGALAALDSGRLEELLAGARAARAADIAHRRAPITGVSEFALPDEAPLDRPPLSDTPTGPLPRIRWAAPFEELRDRVEATRPRPAVFLATLGPLAVHSARLGFAGTLFNAGGFAVLTGPPEQFAASGARVACLCSSDRTYAEQGAAALEVLRAAGAAHVWLAGRGGVPGVDGELFTGCDALAVLRRTLEIGGAPA